MACVHCLSSSGRRDPHELSTIEATALLDELAASPRCSTSTSAASAATIRRDFFELVGYAVDHGIGVNFSTNGTFLDVAAAGA